jgi:hypothetical protein
MERVYSIWIGSQLPLLQQICMQSWLHFGYEYCLFQYAPVANVPTGVKILNANDILPESRVPRYRQPEHKGSPSLGVNIFRYKFLYENGGAWVDADTVLLRPLPGECQNTYLFSSESKILNYAFPGHPNFAFVRAPLGSELMERCYKDAKEQANEAAWGAIGPKLLAKHVQALQLAKWTVPVDYFCALPYPHARKLYKFPPWRPPERAVGLHLWNQVHVRENRNRESVGPRNSCMWWLAKTYLGLDLA